MLKIPNTISNVLRQTVHTGICPNMGNVWWTAQIGNILTNNVPM